MRYFLKLLQVFYSIYAMLIFLIFLIVLFPFVVLAGFLPESTRGNIIYKIVTFWSDGAMFLWGMWHRTRNDNPLLQDHPVIFVWNHISYLDIPVLLKTLRHHPIRILAKSEIAKIPVFGFIYRSAAVLVDRSSAEGRSNSVKKLKATLKKNISIAIAPEGTFNETNMPLKDFYDGAFRIAIETQTPIKPIVFLDTNDRLNYKSIFSFTPGRTRSFFLEEVGVNGLDAGDIDALKMKVYKLMEAALIEHKASWINSE